MAVLVCCVSETGDAPIRVFFPNLVNAYFMFSLRSDLPNQSLLIASTQIMPSLTAAAQKAVFKLLTANSETEEFLVFY